MRRFHDEHFSGPSMAAFTAQFFSKPPEGHRLVDGQEQSIDGQGQPIDGHEQHVDYGCEEEDEEDLGYYEDGTPRTLTDEQIRMFRQSELRELLRHWEKRKAIAAKAGITPVFSVRDPKFDASAQTKRSRDNGNDDDESDQDEDGEASDSAANPSGKSRKRKKKKNKKKNGNAGQRKEPKPDLRKRTWDVVDTGLDSLEYD